MTDALPAEVVRTDRGRDGRWLPGHAPTPGGGRKPGIDIRRVAEVRAKAAGTSLEDELWEVTRTLLALAKTGDVSAARLVADLLIDRAPTELVVSQADAMTDAERAARLEELLRLASERRRAAQKEGNGRLPS